MWYVGEALGNGGEVYLLVTTDPSKLCEDGKLDGPMGKTSAILLGKVWIAEWREDGYGDTRMVVEETAAVASKN